VGVLDSMTPIVLLPRARNIGVRPLTVTLTRRHPEAH
jgi:hypothetical protein